MQNTAFCATDMLGSSNLCRRLLFPRLFYVSRALETMQRSPPQHAKEKRKWAWAASVSAEVNNTN
ncbi:hypothetical protein SCEN_K01330 [Saccharomyces cerevisiae]|nr:hypothetical protein SCEN_K01330 [Saccharomyces cerevisiae]